MIREADGVVVRAAWRWVGGSQEWRFRLRRAPTGAYEVVEDEVLEQVSY